MNQFYNLSGVLASGKTLSMKELEGKVVLIVNTASKCWLVGQYKGLEDLYQKYKNQWLVVLGFPCNQFANQEPGTAEEIKSQCLINYGVTFPIFQKIEVNGDDTHEIFKYLKKESFSFFGSKIKWNFTKFLVSRDASNIKRFAPLSKPEKLEKTIIQLLG